MNHPMMKCGHAANATDVKGNPCCACCVGIKAGAEELDTAPPSLEGRMAKCSCGRTEPSSTSLAFFEYCGPGSPESINICKCGFHYVAHTKEGMANNVPSNRLTVVEQGKCTGFVAHGPREFDRQYCGHAGWD